MDDVVVRVDNVSKDFRYSSRNASSIKHLFTGFLHRNSEERSDDVQHALQDVSFEVRKGEFFGIVGRNGSGKSTLLKMIAGIYQPNKGKISVRGKLVPFIELGVGFNPELTGKENIYLNGALLGFSKKEVDAQYDRIVEFAELEKFMDQKLKNYSSGMQVRLAFSMAVRAEADVLLVDEVLAVGDADFQRKCFDYFRELKKAKKTVIFISHDMTAVREYCDRVVMIEKSNLILEGDAAKVAKAYTRMFIEETEATAAKDNQTSDLRTGDKGMLFSRVSISKSKLNDSDDSITLSMKCTANEDIEDPILGFSVKNASNVQILGTNNKIKGQIIKPMKAGESHEITWTVPNVFADGNYFVDVAAIHHGGAVVCDWWEEAARFKVSREEITPYPVSPHIALEIHGKAKAAKG